MQPLARAVEQALRGHPGLAASPSRQRVLQLIAQALEEAVSASTPDGHVLRMALIEKLAGREASVSAEQMPVAVSDDALLTTAQAAAALEVSRPYVSMLCDNGKLGKVVMTEGGHRRVRASALEAYRIARTRTAEDAPTPREAGIDAGLYDHDDHYYRNVVREQGLSDLKPKARAKRKSPP